MFIRQSVKNEKLAMITSVKRLRLNYLSTVIQQTVINKLLAGTVSLENQLIEMFQQKDKIPAP